jgi:hypothetical protein
MTQQLSVLELFPRTPSCPLFATICSHNYFPWMLHAPPISASLKAYQIWATRWVLWRPLAEGRVTYFHIVLRISDRIIISVPLYTQSIKLQTRQRIIFTFFFTFQLATLGNYLHCFINLSLAFPNNFPSSFVCRCHSSSLGVRNEVC